MLDTKFPAYFAYYLASTETSGVVRSWDECQKMTRGQRGAVHKKFSTHKQALGFLLRHVSEQKSEENHPQIPVDALYFDSGTGGKRGVEVSVTDAKGKSQLYHLDAEIFFEHPLSKWGTYIFPIEEGYTNNFGELFGLFCAMKIAILLGIRQIFGDSQLVLLYWSLGRWNTSKLPERTVQLAQKVTKDRQSFEAGGGIVGFIKGGENPADLGFHRD